MSVLANSMIAVFDSNTNLVWTTEGVNKVIASFKHENSQIRTTFDKIGDEWHVGFESTPDPGMKSAIRVFSGVFQSVREFLEVRQPMTLVFASKAQDLGELYEAYLKRQDTTLVQLGYVMEQVKASPLIEFTIRKKTPSDWRE